MFFTALLNRNKSKQDSDKKEKLSVEDQVRSQGKYSVESSNSRESIEFLKEMYSDIQNIITQHELVNSQHGALATLANKINERIQTVEKISNQSNNVTSAMIEKGNSLIQITDQMVHQFQEGKRSVENVRNQIYQLGGEVKNTSISITKLHESSQEIEKIINVIQGIANQTNLLALNASIEAAHAGEHGLGFSVVANEVRKLAKMTSDSTKSVSDLISRIQNETKDVLTDVGRSLQIVDEEKTVSDDTVKKIDLILGVVDEVQTEVHDVIATIQEQKQASKMVLSEVKSTNLLLKEMNDEILQHIKEASVVDHQLTSSIHQLEQIMNEK